MATKRTKQALDTRPEVVALFAKLKAARRGLEELLEKNSDHWGYFDPVYRLPSDWAALLYLYDLR